MHVTQVPHCFAPTPAQTPSADEIFLPNSAVHVNRVYPSKRGGYPGITFGNTTNTTTIVRSLTYRYLWSEILGKESPFELPAKQRPTFACGPFLSYDRWFDVFDSTFSSKKSVVGRMYTAAMNVSSSLNQSLCATHMQARSTCLQCNF